MIRQHPGATAIPPLRAARARSARRSRVGGCRARLGVLLPVVRHGGRRRRLPALGAAQPQSAERHRVELLSGAWALLLLRPARHRGTDGRDPRCRHRRDRRLVVGDGLAGRCSTAGRGRSSSRRRHRGGDSPGAVPGPDGGLGRRRPDVSADLRGSNVLHLSRVRSPGHRLGGGQSFVARRRRRALRADGRWWARRRPRDSTVSTPTTSSRTAATRSHGSAAKRTHSTCSAPRRSGRATTRDAAAAIRT